MVRLGINNLEPYVRLSVTCDNHTELTRSIASTAAPASISAKHAASWPSMAALCSGVRLCCKYKLLSWDIVGVKRPKLVWDGMDWSLSYACNIDPRSKREQNHRYSTHTNTSRSGYYRKHFKLCQCQPLTRYGCSQFTLVPSAVSSRISSHLPSMAAYYRRISASDSYL